MENSYQSCRDKVDAAFSQYRLGLISHDEYCNAVNEARASMGLPPHPKGFSLAGHIEGLHPAKTTIDEWNSNQGHYHVRTWHMTSQLSLKEIEKMLGSASNLYGDAISEHAARIKFIREEVAPKLDFETTKQFVIWFNKNCPDALKGWDKIAMMMNLARRLEKGELKIEGDSMYEVRRLTVEEVFEAYGVRILPTYNANASIDLDDIIIIEVENVFLIAGHLNY